VGLTHVGMWTDDLKTTIAALRQQGTKVDDPRTGASKAPLMRCAGSTCTNFSEIADIGPNANATGYGDSFLPHHASEIIVLVCRKAESAQTASRNAL
jgi:hypothetical protein